MTEGTYSTIRPFLAALAINRTGESGELPGHYCAQRDVWVIEEKSGPTPIITSRLATSVAPLTKVKGERTEVDATAMSELVTKTAAQLERDDQSPHDHAFLPELATKTDTIRERDDESLSQFLLELSTKTETVPERDD